MDKELIDLTKSLTKSAPLTGHDFNACVGALNCSFPKDYLEFMELHNGAEGEMLESWLQLWPIEELSENNDAYEVPTYLPGILLIGSNGAGEAFGIRKEKGTFIQVPFLFDEIYISDIGSSFIEFLTVLNMPLSDRINGNINKDR